MQTADNFHKDKPEAFSEIFMTGRDYMLKHQAEYYITVFVVFK